MKPGTRARKRRPVKPETFLVVCRDFVLFEAPTQAEALAYQQGLEHLTASSTVYRVEAVHTNHVEGDAH